MSYTRSFTRTVAVHYSGTKLVSYPASKDGGTKYVEYSGTAYEDVEVEIEVDTDPFDASVERCNDNVTGLTASVGVMNAAQCAAITENADKVSQTIIDGFFNTVRTDLSTQRAELEQRIESRLLLLRQQAASLLEMRKKMEDDYARTTARYQKLFGDLNNELSIRIHEVDQPIFDIAKEIDTQNDRMLHTDMIQTAITTSKESSSVQSQLNVARVKHDALLAMKRIQDFLVVKASSERTLQTSCTDGTGVDRYLAPVCYIETESENMQVNRQCHAPHVVPSGSHTVDSLCNALSEVNFSASADSEKEMLQSYFQAEVDQKIKGEDVHSDRVKTMINKLFNI